MATKQKISKKPKAGDIFTFTLQDESKILGQIVFTEGKGMCGLCFFDFRFESSEKIITSDLASYIAFGAAETPDNTFIHPEWKIIGNSSVVLNQDNWPNDKCRRHGHVGSKTYTNGILRKFVNAFYGLIEWNCYRATPDLFYQLLLPPFTAPQELLLAIDIGPEAG